MRGFDAVEPSRLLDGKALLTRVLKRASRKGVTMLLISGLRDFADLCRSSPELVLHKVGAVTIQGGLVPDADSPFGYASDMSQNNEFDPEAAKTVYSFCFEHGLRMSVVSRNAVPLLPMQLARSFAVRTESVVLRYLANAQFLGLAGLWQKLCAGQLPARCDKAWYFATFCGVDGAEFERRALASLDETADILSHLNGFVKPYDVIAAMTVLPTTSGWFPRDAEVVVHGTAHRLLLTEEHALDVRSVHNLLRETYHSVALLDADPDGRGRRGSSWLPPMPSARYLATMLSARGTARSRLHAAANEWRKRPLGAPLWPADASQAPTPPTAQRSSAASRALLRGSGGRNSVHAATTELPPPRAPPVGPLRKSKAWRTSYLAGDLGNWRRPLPPTADGARGVVGAAVSGAAVLAQLHAERLRSADGTASHGLTAALLSTALAEMRARQDVVLRRLSAAALPMAFCAVGVFFFFAVMEPGGSADAGDGEWAALRANLVRDKTRNVVLAAIFCLTGNLVFLAVQVHATARNGSHVAFLRAMCVVNTLVILCIGAAPFLKLLRYVPALIAFRGRGEAPPLWLSISAAASCCQLSADVGSLFCTALAMRRARGNPHGAVGLMWRSHMTIFGGTAVVLFLHFLRHALAGQFALGGGRGAAPFGQALLAFAPTPLLMLGYVFASSPRLKRRAQAMIARPGSGMAGIVASLAPLLAGSDALADDSAFVAEVHAEARGALRAIVLDECGLGALSEAWAIIEARRQAAPRREAQRTTQSADKRAPSPIAARLDAGMAAHAAGGCESLPQRVSRQSSFAPPGFEDGSSVPSSSGHGTGTGSKQWASGGDSLAELARVHTMAVDRFDCYVVHHGGDSAVARVAALRRFSRQFERSTGRPPVAYVDALCDFTQLSKLSSARGSSVPHFASRNNGVGSEEPQASAISSSNARPAGGGGVDGAGGADGGDSAGAAPADTSDRSLRYLAVRLARSSRVVVLASAPLFERLWPALEIFVWRLTGGGLDTIHVVPIARGEDEGSALLAAVDTFHVMYCQAEAPVAQRRIARAVEMASMTAFNDAVRSLFPAVRGELAHVEAAATMDGAADGELIGEDSEWLPVF